MPWVKFPTNVESINLENQDFVPEYINDGKERFFRIPAHFVLKLRATNLGFEFLVQPPAGAPENLIPEPLHENAEAGFKSDLAKQQQQISELRAELNAALATTRQLVGERDDFRRKFELADEENGMLRERLLEVEDPATTAIAAEDKRAAKRSAPAKND